ncbi:MAG: nitroreductase [SAR202 cluster bacterium]|nr:nitroreductase [SAR202 cluster bacterium]
METYQCIRSRLTVRDFRPDPVPARVINKMLRAARWAPSARNRQPWQFIVIQDRDTLAKIGGMASSGGYIARAPLAIAVIMGKVNRADLDAGRALQQMELAAWSEGVGGCFVGLGGEENAKVKALLGVPEELQLITVMPFGYPTDEAKARGKARKPLSEMAHREKFGQKYLQR